MWGQQVSRWLVEEWRSKYRPLLKWSFLWKEGGEIGHLHGREKEKPELRKTGGDWGHAIVGDINRAGLCRKWWQSMAQARGKSGHGLCKGTRRRRKGVKTWRTSPMDNQPQDPPHILNSLIRTKTQIQSSEVGNSLCSPKFRWVLTERKELQNYRNYCSKISNQHFCSSIQI